MTKQETSDQMLRRIRKKQTEEMKGMTDEERAAYDTPIRNKIMSIGETKDGNVGCGSFCSSYSSF